MQELGRFVVLVKAYEEALDFYCAKLGFEKFVDIDAGARRFVHLRLPTQAGFGIWLVQAETEADLAAIGRQAGSQPIAVIYTSDCAGDVARLAANGVTLTRALSQEAGAKVAHFADLYGNEFVLVELDA
jgi:catechol 2,3-dioxygenase-like lactoylglutathione lyase family enzyme